MQKTCVYALCTLIVVSLLPINLVEAKTRAQCEQQVRAAHPPGTLSKRSGSREQLVEACISGSGLLFSATPQTKQSSSLGFSREQRAGKVESVPARAFRFRPKEASLG